PYDKNPRLNDSAVDAVARSIEEFGFRQPVVVDEHGVIIVGHTRWKAAKKLGIDRIPVHVAEGLSPEKAKAYRVADNATATIAEWDLELLPVEIGELKDLGLDLDMLGFDDDELRKLLGETGNPGQCDPDQIPEPPDDPTTKPGDLWVLGDHRLLCGDSASGSDLDRLMDGATAQLVNTDPPYNVKVEPRSNNAISAGLSSFTAPEKRHHQKFDVARHPEKAQGTTKKMRAKDRPLVNDFVTDEAFAAMLLAWFGNLSRVLDPGRAFYIWGGYANVANYPPALMASKLYFSQTIIWDKQHPVLTRKDFMGAHEWCFYGWKEGAAHKFYGPNNVPDLWPVKKVTPQSMIHLTEKPVELAARAMAYSTKPGERVLDLFGGSGSTLIAAEQQGRKAYLMEIDPAYCDVIRTRWETYAGGKAELVASNAPAGEKAPASAGA
ncbi:MAG: ParB N-terminal domain-containing protein, partial [Phycisphaerales bacterium]|nr:ParB N-terminal domain-containing protein [Phycisphaerales bacterium]